MAQLFANYLQNLGSHIQNLGSWGILLFCELGARVKFQNPRTTTSVKKVTGKERGKELLIVATMFYMRHPSAAHKLRLDQQMLSVSFNLDIAKCNIPT